jgi:hypothetical protein
MPDINRLSTIEGAALGSEALGPWGAAAQAASKAVYEIAEKVRELGLTYAEVTKQIVKANQDLETSVYSNAGISNKQGALKQLSEMAENASKAGGGVYSATKIKAFESELTGKGWKASNIKGFLPGLQDWMTHSKGKDAAATDFSTAADAIDGAVNSGDMKGVANYIGGITSAQQKALSKATPQQRGDFIRDHMLWKGYDKTFQGTTEGQLAASGTALESAEATGGKSWGQLSDKIELISNKMEALLVPPVQKIGELLNNVIFSDSNMQRIVGLLDNVKRIVDSIFNPSEKNNFFESLTSLFDPEQLQFIQKIFDDLGDFFNQIKETIVNVAKTFGFIFSGIGKGFGSAFAGDDVGGKTTNIGKTLGQAGDNLVVTFSSVMKQFNEVIGNSEIQKKISDVSASIGQLIGMLARISFDAIVWMLQLFANAILATTNVIKNVVNYILSLADSARRLVNRIIHPFGGGEPENKSETDSKNNPEQDPTKMSVYGYPGDLKLDTNLPHSGLDFNSPSGGYRPLPQQIKTAQSWVDKKEEGPLPESTLVKTGLETLGRQDRGGTANVSVNVHINAPNSNGREIANYLEKNLQRHLDDAWKEHQRRSF